MKHFEGLSSLDYLLLADIRDVSREGDTVSYLKSKHPKSVRFGKSFTLILFIVACAAVALMVKS